MNWVLKSQRRKWKPSLRMPVSATSVKPSQKRRRVLRSRYCVYLGNIWASSKRSEIQRSNRRSLFERRLNRWAPTHILRQMGGLKKRLRLLALANQYLNKTSMKRSTSHDSFTYHCIIDAY